MRAITPATCGLAAEVPPNLEQRKHFGQETEDEMCDGDVYMNENK
tara:strand:- start:1201 stop:1335 length:135 start_codon:yes stop_codon:yes gene_type:complete